MQPASPTPSRAPAFVTAGFVLLAFGALLAVLSLASAELENPSQATGWATAAFVLGALGAALALLGAFRRR